MRTPASIARHPIHPMLVPLPIGLWIFALVADLIHAGGSVALAHRGRPARDFRLARRQDGLFAGDFAEIAARHLLL